MTCTAVVFSVAAAVRLALLAVLACATVPRVAGELAASACIGSALSVAEQRVCFVDTNDRLYCFGRFDKVGDGVDGEFSLAPQQLGVAFPHHNFIHTLCLRIKSYTDILYSFNELINYYYFFNFKKKINIK